MAFESLKQAILSVEVRIGDSDPNKGILIDSNKFQNLTITSNLFSIAPICTMEFLFEQNDVKPKAFDELYINIYKKVEDDEKGGLLLNASLTIMSLNISTITSKDGIFDKYVLICLAAPLYTLTHRLNVSYPNKRSTEVLEEIFGLNSNLSYSLKIDDVSTNDKMNWVFSQRTTLEIVKKILRHMNPYEHDVDIPILFSQPNRETKLTTLANLISKDPKCTLIDSKIYDTIEEKDRKEYIKFHNNTIGVYRAAIPLLSNGYGQMMYQYNPWADMDFGPGIIGRLLKVIQFIGDIINEELKPLDPAFRHPDEEINDCVYRAYESFNFSMVSMMGGTPIKPFDTNNNRSTLKYVGINTPELHMLYNVRPQIYENIVRNFFSNFVNVQCYVNGQHEKYANFSEFPKLGDCVTLSLNTDEDVENIRNGKYLIGKYTLQIDGLDSIPTVQYTMFKDTLNLEHEDDGELE